MLPKIGKPTFMQKKIYCKIKLYMPTPLLQCLEAVEVKN